jgi:NAD-dependent dihydropyrimidine dehydrogenase PreA subunit
MPPKFDEDVCNACGNCVDVCPGDLLAMGEERPVVVYPDECWHCGNCRIHCPVAAVSFVFPLDMVI